MGSLLTANIGNTRVALGWFELPEASDPPQPVLTASAPVPAPDASPFAPEFDTDVPVDAAVLASVNPASDRSVIDWIADRFGVEAERFPTEVPFPIESRCRPPDKVGADRLANALAAFREAHATCLVVDAGTALTVDAVSADGPAFLGGAILPGIALAAHSLARGAALLPNLAVGEPGPLIGTSTSEAMTSGIVRGLAGAVDRLVGEMAAALGGPERIFITGGDGPRLAQLCHTPMAVRPHLTLRGLAAA